MTKAARQPDGTPLCAECGARLTCAECAHDSGETLDDAIQEARLVVKSVLRKPGRNAFAQLQAAKMVLAKDFLAYLTDEELLAEVKRRNAAAAKVQTQ